MLEKRKLQQQKQGKYKGVKEDDDESARCSTGALKNFPTSASAGCSTVTDGFCVSKSSDACLSTLLFPSCGWLRNS